ncbi:MAG: hypothetical protein D6160_06480 [Ketobacter sp.]|nr:MAG: hypothetical protein D6160_06480 [Ketobacter sp.]
MCGGRSRAILHGNRFNQAGHTPEYPQSNCNCHLRKFVSTAELMFSFSLLLIEAINQEKLGLSNPEKNK